MFYPWARTYAPELRKVLIYVLSVYDLIIVQSFYGLNLQEAIKVYNRYTWSRAQKRTNAAWYSCGCKRCKCSFYVFGLYSTAERLHKRQLGLLSIHISVGTSNTSIDAVITNPEFFFPRFSWIEKEILLLELIYSSRQLLKYNARCLTDTWLPHDCWKSIYV